MAEYNRPDSVAAGNPNLRCSTTITTNWTKKRGVEFDEDSDPDLAAAKKKTRAEEEGSEKAQALLGLELGGPENRAVVRQSQEDKGSRKDSQSQVHHSVSDLLNEEDAHSNQSARGLEFAIEAAASDDKGSRRTMEDAWVVLPDAGLEFPGKLRCAHFAIYDGHGGRLAAEYAKRHLHANVLSAGLPRELLDVKAAKKAILDGFRKTDESLLQESTAGGWHDGATAVCLWILGQTVFVANIGDAKAVVARSTNPRGLQISIDEVSSLKAIVLTREHKAIYPQERVRIQKAGGSVSSNGRLQGRLEVSRAFGDPQFKKVGVVSTPDVRSFDLTDREHFIILGCDGLWGVFGPSDAVLFVQKLLKEGLPVVSVCRCLVREAVRERHCKDNCTAIVIVFNRV